jgi:hypothetical protein
MAGRLDRSGQFRYYFFNMIGLWADGWFYVSAAGFLVSSALFVFLLSQYRAAVEAEDEGAPAAVEAAPLRPDFPIPAQFSKGERTERTLISSVSEPAPVPLASQPRAQPVASAFPAEPPPKNRSESTLSGGSSPAVAYLQNIKEHMDKVEREVVELRAMAMQQAQQNETILSRLGELAQRFDAQPQQAVSEVHVPAAEPPAMAAASEAAPEAVPEAAPPMEAPPAPAEGFEPAATPSTGRGGASTLELTLTPPEGGQAPGQAGGPASEEPKPARKGPVWPI